MQINASAELGWLALRYVARRMTAEEISSFEARLFYDQPAREAVAQAVELAHSVAALHAGNALRGGHSQLERALCHAPQNSAASTSAEVLPIKRRAAGSNRRLSAGLLAAGLAATLLVTVFSTIKLSGGHVRRPQTAIQTVQFKSPRDPLSTAWASLDASLLRQRAREASANDEPAEEGGAEARDAAADAIIPAWMLHGLRDGRRLGDRGMQEM